ncbi:hypothetical protein UFOVP112_52 [uncultured Caudovirales phage]|uniref:Uncharacterized protein n=1 Tax=uncultured Caudovirales phage TaxID=2100421 RepID=A0A6J5L617_9CAUD|nr:hypothetical protein UFOVP112_52 [uncultured Caudovirales phage]
MLWIEKTLAMDEQKCLDPLGIEVAHPHITESDIVFLGCSYTSGEGVFRNSRYSSIVAEQLDKQEINLAKGGCGNYRSFDVFGQLNIDNNATVILQLTELSRIRWYTDSIYERQLSNPANDDYHRSLLTVYHDKFLIHDLIRQLRIIVNYCRAKDLKLVIWSIARFNNQELDTAIETYLSKFPEYVFLDNRLNTPDSYRVDNGTDGRNRPLGTGHPGPESHKLIAEKLVKHFNKLYL